MMNFVHSNEELCIENEELCIQNDEFRRRDDYPEAPRSQSDCVGHERLSRGARQVVRGQQVVPFLLSFGLLLALVLRADSGEHLAQGVTR